MIIDVRLIPLGRSTQQHTVTAFPENEGWPRFAGGLQCRFDIDRTAHEILIRIAYHGEVLLSCARCLADVTAPISGDTVVVARCSEHRGQAGYVDDDSGEYRYDDQELRIDLAQALFDEVVTGLPMKPLCREQCPGVSAGAQQARKPEGEIDPRWEALRALRGKP